ncbi:hypothetical protein RhiJN_24096 [Ceratobasidium sp. AG-Ba]|nr:hypothetical protein RhiJN_24096 [Ceratobasidium sp. AG-Ba]
MTSKPPKRTRIHQTQNETPSQDVEHSTLDDPSSTAPPRGNSQNQPSTGAYNQNPSNHPANSAARTLRASLHIFKKSTKLVPALRSAVDVLVDCFDHMTVRHVHEFADDDEARPCVEVEERAGSGSTNATCIEDV